MRDFAPRVHRRGRQPRIVPLVGVVLAGGLSSRLGRDKALLRLYDGGAVDLLARTARLLSEVTDVVRVVGREQPGYQCLADICPGCGPVGGIATALFHASGAACLVLSCDLPFMEKAVLERLIAARNARPADAWMTAYHRQETGRTESLVAIYEPQAEPCLEACIRHKLLKIRLVVPPENQYLLSCPAADFLPFFNINGPADLETARRIIRERNKGERGSMGSFTA